MITTHIVKIQEKGMLIVKTRAIEVVISKGIF